MGQFLMPSLGADMEAATLVEWLKQPGDEVHRGDIIAVVETQKGAIEVEVFETGVLERLLVETGTEVPVGTPLALISGTGEAAAQTPATAAPAAPPASSEPPPPVVSPAAALAPPPVVTAAAARARVSPAARRHAAALGIDPAALTGSGPGGAVVLADVERAGAAAKPEPGGAPRAAVRRGLDLAAMRTAIAAAMARSKREIPHYYLGHAVDMEPVLGWLQRVNAARTPAERLLPAAALVKAVARAVAKVPEMNGFMTPDGFRASAAVHAGVAIAIRGGGLVAPAIHDVERLHLDELMAKLRDLVARTRAGSLRSSELADPTITVSSLGERGVDTLLGVIYPPQVAIVGFGSPAPRPWVVDGAVAPRRVAGMTLAADHRVSDGHRGALFLAEIERLLQRPEEL